jgi:hypothetical protein
MSEPTILHKPRIPTGEMRLMSDSESFPHSAIMQGVAQDLPGLPRQIILILSTHAAKSR